MGNIKPLGSEKLTGSDKMKRIMELTYYNTNTSKPTINENKNANAEIVVEGTNGTFYGIFREKNDYYVKKGLNENTLDYIGGMFMKNKNRFNSYSDALKRMDLLKGQEELQESTKYVLKQKSQEPPVSEPAPVEDEPIQDPTMDTPESTEEPIQDPTMDAPMDSPEGGEETSEDKKSDYMSEIQKFSGKLGQELRDQKERLESDDIKYVLNMIISAVDLNKLDESDLDDVVKNFDRGDGEDMDDMESEDEEYSDTPEEDELSEVDGDDEFGDLEDFINTPFDTEDEMDEIDLSDYADLNEDDEMVEEIDLEKIKQEINDNTSQILSKYFR